MMTNSDGEDSLDRITSRDLEDALNGRTATIPPDEVFSRIFDLGMPHFREFDEADYWTNPY
jgi:hypothetical protein